MSRFGWNSVRARLTFWNGMVLAFILAGSGIVLCHRVQADLAASVDAELAASAQQFAVNSLRFERRVGLLPLNGARGSRSRRASPRLRSHAAAARDTNFRRPRMFRPDGRPMDPEGMNRPWDPDALVRSAGGQAFYTTIQVERQPVRIYTFPLPAREGKVARIIQMARPLGDLERLTQGLFRMLLTLFPLALLLAGLTGIFLTNRTLRPMRKITHAAARIGVEDLSQRLEVTGQDEFAELAATFNGMVARLEQAFHRLENAYARLERAFEHQQRFTADASHELRTPLTRIKGSASMALAGSRSEEGYRKALQVVDGAADAMNRLIQDLLLLARADAQRLRLELGPVEVATLFDHTVSAVAEGAPVPIGVELPSEPLTVIGSFDSLVRLLANLITNAVRHAPAEGQITLSAQRQDGTVMLRVADTGEGISPEHLPHVCDRFYRVDAARNPGQGGTGLGLAICQSIVEAHGGSLTIESVVGAGTTVTIQLPGPGTHACRATSPRVERRDKEDNACTPSNRSIDAHSNSAARQSAPSGRAAAHFSASTGDEGP